MEETSENKSSGYGKRPMWQWIVVYLVIAAVVYGAFYYFVLAKKGGGSVYTQPAATQTQTTTPTTAAAQPTTTTTNTTTNAVMENITVTGTEYAFTPSTITVKKGEVVKLTFKNAGTYPHNFTLADLNVKTKTIQPGQQDTITFTPTKTGSFAYICTVPGHADRGMKGTLTVE